jgi:hypothetical protein
MRINNQMVGLEEPLQVVRVSILRVLGSYVTNKPDEEKKTAKLFRTEWMVEQWFGNITISQFLFSFVSRMFQNILCPLQSKYVRWTSISVTFFVGEEEKTLRQPVVGVSGRMENSPDCTLGMELFYPERRGNKYRTQLQGATSNLDSGDRSEKNKDSQALINLESLFFRSIFLAVHKTAEREDKILNLTLESPLHSSLETFKNSFRNTETRTLSILQQLSETLETEKEFRITESKSKTQEFTHLVPAEVLNHIDSNTSIILKFVRILPVSGGKRKGEVSTKGGKEKGYYKSLTRRGQWITFTKAFANEIHRTERTLGYSGGGDPQSCASKRLFWNSPPLSITSVF